MEDVIRWSRDKMRSMGCSPDQVSRFSTNLRKSTLIAKMIREMKSSLGRYAIDQVLHPSATTYYSKHSLNMSPIDYAISTISDPNISITVENTNKQISAHCSKLTTLPLTYTSSPTKLTEMQPAFISNVVSTSGYDEYSPAQTYSFSNTYTIDYPPKSSYFEDNYDSSTLPSLEVIVAQPHQPVYTSSSYLYEESFLPLTSEKLEILESETDCPNDSPPTLELITLTTPLPESPVAEDNKKAGEKRKADDDEESEDSDKKIKLISV